MSENIFRIRTELELDEILENNKYKLVSVIYSTNNQNYLPKETDILLKKLLKRVMAPKYKNNIFVYVNLSDFVFSTDKYTGNVTKENIPVAHFFWDFTRICVIEKVGHESFITVFEKLIKDIEDKVTSQLKTQKEQSAPVNQEPTANVKDETIAKPENKTPDVPVPVNPNDNTPEVPKQPETSTLNVPPEQLNGIDQKVIEEQLLCQKKMEEIEKLRTIHEINELKKIKKLKEDEENK